MSAKRSYRDLYLFCERLMRLIYWDYVDGNCPEDQYENLVQEFSEFAKPKG